MHNYIFNSSYTPAPKGNHKGTQKSEEFSKLSYIKVQDAIKNNCQQKTIVAPDLSQESDISAALSFPEFFLLDKQRPLL